MFQTPNVIKFSLGKPCKANALTGDQQIKSVPTTDLWPECVSTRFEIILVELYPSDTAQTRLLQAQEEREREYLRLTAVFTKRQDLETYWSLGLHEMEQCACQSLQTVIV